MSGVADGELARGGEVRGDDGGGESSGLVHFGELPVQLPDQPRLALAVDVLSHQCPQLAGHVGHHHPMSGHIGENKTGDDSPAAQRDVMHVAPGAGLAIRPAVDPQVESWGGHGILGVVAATPDFHALQRVRHEAFVEAPHERNPGVVRDDREFLRFYDNQVLDVTKSDLLPTNSTSLTDM